MGQRSLSAQALILTLGSGLAQVLVAILYILTARSMQPAEFGVVATAIALGLAGAAFADLGAGSYWIRELASGRVALPDLYSKMLSRLLYASAIALLVICLAMLTEPQFAAAGVLLLSRTTLLTMFVPLRAARKADLVGWLTILGRVVSVLAFFALMYFGAALGVALWVSLAIGDVALVAYMGITAHSQFDWKSFSLSNPWSGAKWYSLSALSVSAQQLDLPLVGAFAGAGAAGIYGGVNRWIQPMLLAISAFASSAAPFLALESDQQAVRRQVMRASWILIFSIIISISAIWAAPWLVSVLLGDAFASSSVVLRWLAGAMIINTFTQPLIVALQSKKHDRMAAFLLLISVASHLLIVVVFAPTLGATSAGIGMFTSQLLQFVGALACIAVIVLRRRRASKAK